MATSNRSAELLHTIATALGTEADTFVALRRTAALCGDGGGPDAGDLRLRQLMRMIDLFRRLPDDASRLQAMAMLEALAARCAERSVAADRAPDAG